MTQFRIALVIFALLGVSSRGEASTIFTNYGPGGTYLAGNGLGTSSPTASSFTPTMDALLTSISLALEKNGPTQFANIYLMADSGGVPGIVLESFLNVAVTSEFDVITSPPVTVTSTLMPALSAGTLYWVGVQQAAGSTNVFWDQNSTGDTGRAFSTGTIAGPWTATPLNLAGAFSVDGQAAAVPEPGSLLLLGSGAAGLVVRLRRRKGTQ